MTQIQKLLIVIAAAGMVSLLHAMSGDSVNLANALRFVPELNSSESESTINQPLSDSAKKALMSIGHAGDGVNVDAIVHVGDSIEATYIESAHIENTHIVNNIYENEHGGFYFKQGDEASLQTSYLASSVLRSEFDVQVNANIQRTKVTQYFENTSGNWQDGVYVFPLPEDAAVDAMTMQIGERKIIGQIREKQVAKAEFEAAKKTGKSASLIEQIRPNMFVNKIANIAPRTGIEVTIEYQEVIDFNDSRFELRIPTTITPRYSAKKKAPTHSNNQVTPSIVPSTSSKDFSIEVSINMGMAISDVRSEHHKISTEPATDNNHGILVSLDEVAPVAKEFVLHWSLASIDKPEAAHLSHIRDNQQYGLIQIVPPSLSSTDSHEAKRELTFILDTSGSMVGDAIEQAKMALISAIDELRAEDSFNVIEFNSRAVNLWDSAQAANVDNKMQATRFVKKLEASGGTEIAEALSLAFDLQDDEHTKKTTAKIKGESEHVPSPLLHQILFITDGSVSNEAQLLSLITERLGKQRLFTIGIGSAPNTYFMSEAAIAGRGTFTLIGDVSQVHSKMTALLNKIKRPALTDIELILHHDDPQTTFEVFPSKIPDVYAGEPITLLYRLKSASHVPLETQKAPRFSLQAQWYDANEANTPAHSMIWKSALPEQRLALSTIDSGIPKQWAFYKIQQLKRALNTTPSQGEDYLALQQYTQKQITEMALSHGLLSDYTSLLAIDDQQIKPSKQYQAMLKQKALEQNRIDALSNKKWSVTQMHLPQTSTSSRLYFTAGLTFFGLAALWFMLMFTGRR